MTRNPAAESNELLRGAEFARSGTEWRASPHLSFGSSARPVHQGIFSRRLFSVRALLWAPSLCILLDGTFVIEMGARSPVNCANVSTRTERERERGETRLAASRELLCRQSFKLEHLT